MMNIKARYLLEAGLEILHFEAMEWIEEAEFDIHELSVLGMLINSKNKADSVGEQKHQDLIHTIDKCLKRLGKELLPGLQAHERYLSGLLTEGTEINHPSYRGKHKAFSQKIIRLNMDIKRLKKEVYAFLVVGDHQQRHGFPT